jgi:tetratricopeptide (TPR) repeat protein
MSDKKTRAVFFGIFVVTGFSVAISIALDVHPIDIYNRLEFKANELLLIESQHRQLQKKYFELQHDYFELETRHNNLLAKVQSGEEAVKNIRLTGSKEGRSLSTIPYSVPSNLTVEQKYLLAFSHMREGRFEEAAKTFDQVLSIPEGALYQTAQTFYESGVAWFEIKNYKKAREAFQATKIRADGVGKPEMLRKVELWMKILDQRKLASAKESAHE